MTGAVLSTYSIAIVNDRPVFWPELFVAVQCTVVVPTGNMSPDVWSHETGSAPSSKSLALGEKVSGFPAGSCVTSWMSAGTDTAGAASRTVTVKLTGSASFPAGSCPWHVTVVAPIGNMSPEPSEPQTMASAPAGSSGSVAVTSNVTGAPSFEVAVAF